MTLNRRNFFRIAGGAAVSLPFLPSVMRADEPSAASPKRFIFIANGNANHRDSYWPWRHVPPPGVDFRRRSEDPVIREMRLRDIPGETISPGFHEDLNAFRDQILLIRGLDLMAGEHGMHKVLGRYPRNRETNEYSESLDQVMARSRAVYDVEPKARSLHLMAYHRSSGPALSVARNGAGELITRPRIKDPRAAFDQLFGTGTVDEAELKRQRMSRVLGRTQELYGNLEHDPRLSPSDRRRVESHGSALSDLMRRLGASVDCSRPEPPPTLDVRDELSTTQMFDSHVELLATAIKCDLTRVATLEFGRQSHSNTMPYLPDGPLRNPDGSTTVFHEGVSHWGHSKQGQKRREYSRINRYITKRIARLMTLLDEVEDPETGRTYLDNTIIYWGSEFGTSTTGHHGYAMPVFVAGGSFFFDTGRYVDFQQANGDTEMWRDIEIEKGLPILRGSYELGPPGYDLRGLHYSHFQTTLLNAMGVPYEEYEESPGSGFGHFRTYMDMHDVSDRRGGLPALARRDVRG